MILVFGKTGQVASELQELLPGAYFASREEADLSDPASCAKLVEKLKPSGVIIAAAYTAVDRAEEEVGLARTINAAAPGAIAESCAKAGVPLVHISTDYVFGGEGVDAHSVNSPIAPLNIYGQTKADGEQSVRDSGVTHAIIRTSWVFSRHGSNFVKTMLRLGSERDALNIVADQIGGPTPASSIAQTCVSALRAITLDADLSGTYHLSGAPDVSWADFARTIFAEAGLEVVVSDIATSDFPTPARRPGNSRLDCSNLSAIGASRPEWRPALQAIIEDFKAS